MVLITDLMHINDGIEKCRMQMKKRDLIDLFLVDEQVGGDELIRCIGGDFSIIRGINRVGKSAYNQAMVICMLVKGLPQQESCVFCFDVKLEREIISTFVNVYHDTSYCRWEKKKDQTAPVKRTKRVKRDKENNNEEKIVEKNPEVSGVENEPNTNTTEGAVVSTNPMSNEEKSSRKKRIKITDEMKNAVLADYFANMKSNDICDKYNLSKSAYYGIVKNLPRKKNIDKDASFVANEDLILELTKGVLTKENAFKKYDLSPHTFSLTLKEMEKRGLCAQIVPERTNIQEEIDSAKIGAASIQSDIRIDDRDIMVSSDNVKYIWNIEVNEEIRKLFAKYAFSLDDTKILMIEKIFQYYEIKKRDPFGELLGEDNKKLEKDHFNEVLKNNHFVFPANISEELYDLFWYFKTLDVMQEFDDFEFIR